MGAALLDIVQNSSRSRVSARDRLELWGGLECTINRVGDSWFDQTPRTGHDTRISDLALFAELGTKSLRYPALWERMSPETPDVADFSWTDERLAEIRRLRMNPILTLCHHGSGPKYTTLLEDSFAPGLARHEARAARREGVAAVGRRADEVRLEAAE